MKKIVTLAITLALLSLTSSVYAQRGGAKLKFPDYQFTTVLSLPITSVKDQDRSNTCWAHCGVSFFESEIIRINNIKDPADYPNLSVMYIVSQSYKARGDKFVRLDGNLTFAGGSEVDDALHVIEDFGLVPAEVMPGNNYGTKLPALFEMDAILKAYAEAVVENPNGALTTAWKKGYDAILDSYLGPCPEKFTFNGKEYTPASYRDALKFNPEDYVGITSFTHHPFYKNFAIEICDNWRWDELMNVPIDELMETIDYALEHGFTVCWGADTSHPGYTYEGFAILADTDAKPTAGSDQEKWVGKSGEILDYADASQVIESETTQEIRQQQFDNKMITDDHGMHIFGIAKDQNGKKYYMVKNSLGEIGRFGGIWYVSEAFVRNQSIDVIVHKDAVPQHIAKKIGIK